MAGAISQDRETCQLLFCLNENPMLYRAAREESGREAPEGVPSAAARSNSERAVGLRWQAVFGCQIGWIDRLDAPAHAVGRGSVALRWLRILTITGGSSIAAMIFKAQKNKK